MNEIHELIIEAHIEGPGVEQGTSNRSAEKSKQIEKAQLVEDVVRQVMQRLRDETINDNGSAW